MEQHDNGLLAYIKYQQFEQAITNKAEANNQSKGVTNDGQSNGNNV